MGDGLERFAGTRLGASYARCRALHRVYGRTYYLATHLLPAWKRPHVHALYGFTRYTDDIVDRGDTMEQRVGAEAAAVRAARLRSWKERFAAVLAGAPTDDPILPAVRHTVEVFGLDLADFAAFFRSMEMDLTVTEYRTYHDLLGYMEGSAAAVGSMMLPVLCARRGLDPLTSHRGPLTLNRADIDRAREPARQLGLAFQLTNFIRDVGEDLDRGRIYLPLKDLADFGVTAQDLRARVATSAIRELVTFEVGRAQVHYARAAVGVPLLPPASQRCIHAAYRLYGGILDEVVRAGYDVLSRRATVPTRRRLLVAAASLLTRPGRPVRLPAT